MIHIIIFNFYYFYMPEIQNASESARIYLKIQ